MSALSALERDPPEVLALNAMEAYIDLSNPHQLGDYVLHSLDIKTQFGNRDEDIRRLTAVIRAVANMIRNNNLRGFSFDPSFTLCGICGRPGHTFANYKLLKDKGKVIDAFTKLVMALKKLIRLADRNLGTASSLALQGLSIINALHNHQF